MGPLLLRGCCCSFSLAGKRSSSSQCSGNGRYLGAGVRDWQGWLSGKRYSARVSAEGWTDVIQQMEGRSFLLQTQMHLHHLCVDPTYFIWHRGPAVLNKDVAGLLLFLAFLCPGSWAVSWMWPLEILQRCSGTQQQGLGAGWKAGSWPAFISGEALVILR